MYQADTTGYGQLQNAQRISFYEAFDLKKPKDCGTGLNLFLLKA